jgi:hypothetical protein
MPTVKVIIAARRAARWVGHCVESVVSQRLPCNWRLCVAVGVDACLETLAAAQGLIEHNAEVFYFPQHVGPYVIFNSLASGEKADALVRFDADDVMLQEYLYAQILTLDSRLSPMITRTWSIYTDEQLRPTQARLANSKITDREGRRPSGSDGQFLMTESVLRRLGGFQPWLCHADTEFIRRARWAGVPLRLVPAYLYLRRTHSGSLIASPHTGYDSDLRRFYGKKIAAAGRRYSNGEEPERIWPVIMKPMRIS